MKKLWIILLLSISSTSLFAMGDGGNGKTGITFSMGAQTGSMYGTGIALSDFMAKNYPDIITSVKVGGAIGNIELVNSNQAQIGHTSSSLAFAAINGKEPFKEKKTNIRAIVKLLESSFQFAITKSSGVSSLEEIAQKQYPLKLSVGPKNRENELLSRIVLAEYGITYEKIKKWGGRIEFVSIGDTSSLIRDGQIEAVTILAGNSYAPIEEMNIARSFQFLGLNDQVRKNLNDKYGYIELAIPAGSYTGLTQNIKTVGGGVVLIANKDVSEQVIYDMTKWMNSPAGQRQLGALSGGIKSFLDGSVQTISGLGVPLHDGAAKFYRESGLLK